MESQKLTPTYKLARSPNGTPTGGLLSGDKRVKKIIEWVEAYSYLIDQDTKYLELSINENDKKLSKKYREISDHFEERVKELINATP
ncbi:MAG: hypothetical protein A2163_07985 [Actinobacteria bacterium RBG_13_35_12]|nr:MAG: hypothetical protein A2163_07985 [Actinobacteria bacterium RBG_13_35_12]